MLDCDLGESFIGILLVRTLWLRGRDCTLNVPQKWTRSLTTGSDLWASCGSSGGGGGGGQRHVHLRHFKTVHKDETPGSGFVSLFKIFQKCLVSSLSFSLLTRERGGETSLCSGSPES